MSLVVVREVGDMEVVELPLRRGIAFEEVGGEVERLEVGVGGEK